MLRLASLVMIAAPLVGCAVHAPNMRTELVASGAPGNTIQLPQGIYDLNLRVGVPQAQVVHWTLTCPGVEKEGVVGETFDNYRERRLSEINAQQERDRKTASSAASFAASLAPRVVATNGPVTAQAGVDPNAAGAAAAASVPTITELPPGDLGAGTLFAKLQFMTASDGACSLALNADDPRVQAAFDVTRTFDVDVENARHAQEVRGTLVAQLSAQGADPDARAKRLYAEAQAQERIAAEEKAKRDAELVVIHEREATEREQRAASEEKEQAAHIAAEASARAEYEERVERERKLRIEFEMHLRVSIESTRRLLIGYLVGIGADAGHYAAEQERIRIEMEMRLRIEMEETERREARLRIEQDARDRREAEANRQRWAREAMIAQQRQHAIDVAMSVRAALRARLLALGARERPDMPAPLQENRGTSPFDGAVWVAGSWTFSESSWSWSWTQGGWSDSASFGDSGTAGGDVRAPVAVEEPAPVVEAAVVTPVVVHPTVVVETRTPIVTVSVPAPTITIRTHTTTVRPKHEAPPRSSPARPVIRDHRK